jgi:hypothetical protein
MWPRTKRDVELCSTATEAAQFSPRQIAAMMEKLRNFMML